MKCLTKDCKNNSLLMTVELCYPCSQIVEKGKREWVGLTDEEIRDIHWSKPMDEYSFARAIEAKLKEKNSE